MPQWWTRSAARQPSRSLLHGAARRACLRRRFRRRQEAPAGRTAGGKRGTDQDSARDHLGRTGPECGPLLGRMEAREGIEPSISGFAGRHVATSSPRRNSSRKKKKPGKLDAFRAGTFSNLFGLLTGHAVATCRDSAAFEGKSSKTTTRAGQNSSHDVKSYPMWRCRLSSTRFPHGSNARAIGISC